MLVRVCASLWPSSTISRSHITRSSSLLTNQPHTHRQEVVSPWSTTCTSAACLPPKLPRSIHRHSSSL